MKRVPTRLKILKGIRRLSHRYNRLRVLGMTAAFATLFSVPLTGLAQIDLWQGNHRLLFEPAPFKHALAGLIVAIAAMYVVTFLSNVVAGRLFCGWGCPVGQVSRFGEALDTPRLSRRDRIVGHVKGASFSFALVMSFVVWWVDPRVLWAGSPRAAGIAWGIVALGVIAAWMHGRYWQWNFCKSACPIGLYYSFVSPASWFGIHFRNQHDTCLECNACDNACPVGLAPRDLMAPIPARAGISIADAPGRNHCLECGDCVRACEWMIDLKGEGPVPLLLGHYRGEQAGIETVSPEQDFG